MKLYLYAHSGHNFGLELIRQSCAIAKQLIKFNPILCTSDYRSATYAKQILGVEKSVGIDIVRNLANVLEKGDILILNDDNISNNFLKEIKEFCGLFYKIGDTLPSIIVDKTIYKSSSINIQKAFFYGDDDYDNWLLSKSQKEDKKYDISLLMGYYNFYNNEVKLSKYFKNIIDEEKYIQTIKTTKYLLTGSYQSALESLYCGNYPVLLKRSDKIYDNNLNIPQINNNQTLENIFKQFDNIILNYPKTYKIPQYNFDVIYNEIDNKFKLFNAISNQVFE